MTLREYFKNRIRIFKYGQKAKKNNIAMRPEDTKYGREKAFAEKAKAEKKALEAKAKELNKQAKR